MDLVLLSSFPLHQFCLSHPLHLHLQLDWRLQLEVLSRSVPGLWPSGCAGCHSCAICNAMFDNIHVDVADFFLRLDNFGAIGGHDA